MATLYLDVFKNNNAALIFHINREMETKKNKNQAKYIATFHSR